MSEFAERTELGSVVFPPGVMIAYGNSSPPVGWLECDGSLVLREQYSALFDVIGIGYGAGDGSKTFALPDMRNVSPVGATG